MTVGDFVNIRRSAPGAHIYRVIAELDAETSAEAVVSKPIFTGPQDAPSRESRRLRIFVVLASVAILCAVFTVAAYQFGGTRPAIALAGAGVVVLLVMGHNFYRSGNANGRQSLIAIMADNHDVGLQPTASGLEAIGVPFPHAILLMGRDRFEYRSALEAQATAAFNKKWKNYVDPLVGLRARVLVSGRFSDNELMAFFGTGIFAPRPGERPIGRIEVRQPDTAEILQPCLPDRTPAGLYRGQSALAFSTSIELTPATIDALPGVSGTFCLRPNLDSAQFGPYVLEWEPGPDKSIFKPARESVEPPPGFDALFRVSFPETTFEVYVIDDARPSRLLYAPPRGRSFAIIGTLEPTIDGRSPDRWWIDLDDNGRLIASATRRARKSLVCRKDVMTVWDWSAPAVAASHAAKIQTLRTPEGPRRVLMAPPTRPFGWLAAPARSSAIAYTPGQTMQFELDWLDFAGAVEEVLGRGERLGAWMHLHKNGGPFPGIDREQGDETLLVMPAGETDFQPGWRGAFPPGIRIICDALLLEVVDGDGP